MKAILIDAFEKTVYEVEHDGTLEETYRLLRCDTIDVVRVDDRNVMFVDDNGLYTHNGPDAPFIVFPSGLKIAGSALIVGDADDNGDTTATTLDGGAVSGSVLFTTLGELTAIGEAPKPMIRFFSLGG